MKITDYVAQIENKQDEVYLKSVLPPVCMHLFHSSRRYNSLIMNIISYMDWEMNQKWEDYGSNTDGGTYGISGANLAIPFNIIGYRNDGSNHFMINPVILSLGGELVDVLSNCGSIRLAEKIKVSRHTEIIVNYFNMDGTEHEELFRRKDGSFTIQHEVDHNLGILITDGEIID